MAVKMTKKKGTGSSVVSVSVDEIMEVGKFKADIESQAAELEDEFEGYYIGSAGTKADDLRVIKPPFDPRALRRMAAQNNTLAPCIAAMEVNIDGTGHEVIPVDPDDDPDDDTQKQAVQEFLDEPWPGVSMVTLRRRLRRDEEEVGYAFAEMIRTPAGELMFMRRVDSATIRKCKLEDPVDTKVVVRRGGKDVEVSMSLRRRKLVQIIGKKKIYFKEYGVKSDLNKSTGEWAEAGSKLPAKDRASELLEFGVHEDVDTPYFVPRWISQTPSVVGSRMAEESNLSMFEAGGIPPAIVFLKGGKATEDGQTQLDNLAKTKNKTRLAVVSLQATNGGINSTGSVDVQVERFGSEQSNDAMYDKYDDKTEAKVRRGFRLPPLFVGNADGYNYATAYASYLVAESQVFLPERKEFDEIMNNGPIRELSGGRFRMKSNPLNTKDINSQLRAIGIAVEKGAIDNEELIKKLNSVTGMGMEYNGNPDPLVSGQSAESLLGTQSGAVGVKLDSTYLHELVDRMAESAGLTGEPVNLDEIDRLKSEVNGLSNLELAAFKVHLIRKVAAETGDSPEDVLECCEASIDTLLTA